MKINVQFKTKEILALISICIVSLGMRCVVLFYDVTLITFKAISAKVIVIGIAFVFMFHLYLNFRRLSKSINKVTALEIDDLGISNNTSQHRFLEWRQISHFNSKTVQMSSGRHSKILVHTYEPELSMKINTDILNIDKDELLDILNKNIGQFQRLANK